MCSVKLNLEMAQLVISVSPAVVWATCQDILPEVYIVYEFCYIVIQSNVNIVGLFSFVN